MIVVYLNSLEQMIVPSFVRYSTIIDSAEGIFVFNWWNKTSKVEDCAFKASSTEAPIDSISSVPIAIV